MVGSSKESHLVDLVADYLLVYLEEELFLVQLSRVELPFPAERCPLGSPQRMGDGHSQAHLDSCTLEAVERTVKVSENHINGSSLAKK